MTIAARLIALLPGQTAKSRYASPTADMASRRDSS